MTKETFSRAIYEISTFFERKEPKVETKAQWFEQVKHISDRIVAEVLSEIKKLETFPRNLPALMNHLAMMISEKNGDNEVKIHDRRFHPDRWANKDCPKCKGEGLYDFHMDWPIAKEGDRIITKPVVRRALCPCTDKWEMGG